MSAPAAISGDFTTAKHVPTRKVWQIVIEVPEEAASAMFAALGHPTSGAQRPVAVARLVEQPKADIDQLVSAITPENRHEEVPTGNSRKSWDSLPLSQQAAIRCGEEGFQRFMIDKGWQTIPVQGSYKPGTVDAVRKYCGIESRGDIVSGTPAGKRWAELEAEYWSWQRGRR